MIIEGNVKLPPTKPASEVAARYQQKAGKVAPPSPPVAVVYLEGTFPLPNSNSPTTNQIAQENYQFTPGILPIQRGGKVEFPNRDDDYHHVFSYSKTKEFDLGRYRQDEKPAAVPFPKAGLVKVGCEIHDHMRAYILVLDTPHFTRTDTNGNYRLVLMDVPPGKYALKAWIHERSVLEQQVDLNSGANLKVNFPAK